MTGEPQSLVLLVTALIFTCLLALRGRTRKARTARTLNRALHELRRPLQVLALTSPGGRSLSEATGSDPGFRRVISGASLHDPVEQAIRALAELDRAINGGPGSRTRSELVAVKLMADACVRRWLPRARLAGCELGLRWSGQDVLVRGDGLALAAALENLILNAIEHGGSGIEVSGSADARSVTVAVSDTGLSDRRESSANRPDPGDEGRRGHGLEIATETIRAHGGKLDLDLGPDGSRATIVMPLARVGTTSGKRVRVNW